MDGENEVIYFYSTLEEPYGCFSNFSAHGFVLDDAYWPTSEHYFQAQKFVGTSYAEKIRAARSPKIAANLGRSRKEPLRPDWEQVKDDVMRRAVLRKFQTHDSIRQVLLSTDEALLVENSPTDYYWGCGADGSGLNRLGEVLMEIRQQLRREG